MFNPLNLLVSGQSRFQHCLHSCLSTNFNPGQYSFTPDSPELVLSQTPEQAQSPETFSDFMRAFDRLIADRRVQRDAQPYPFMSGWLVYFSFDSYRNWRGLGQNDAPQTLPRACLWRVDRLLIQDHSRQTISYCQAGRILKDIPTELSRLIQSLGEDEDESDGNGNGQHRLQQIVEQPDEDFLQACQKIIGAIGNGDVIQVNLSKSWRLQLQESIATRALAKSLAQVNPASFFCCFPVGPYTIISASPERLLRVTGNRIETQPLGGTIHRDLLDLQQDEVLKSRLRRDPKMQAEHTMLVDLERNDMAKICRPRSVEVAHFMGIETQPHLHHLLSVIQGQLLEDISPSAIFQAMCPGGSISGCPKKICLEMLEQLETEPREWYTGAYGYIDDSGAMDINLLIRSMAVKANEIYLRAGAGIVADSNPLAELLETKLKMRGLAHSLYRFFDQEGVRDLKNIWPASSD